MNKWQLNRFFVCLLFTGALSCHGQESGFWYPSQQNQNLDLMDTRNFNFREYRLMFNFGKTPTIQELQGTWRGVNKGVVTLVGFKQFVKQIESSGCLTIGTNIQTHQVSTRCLRSLGWQPKFDPDGRLQNRGSFVVRPECRSHRQNSVEFSYRDGRNPPRDMSRLFVDRVTKIDEHHMLGRASVQISGIRIPVAYFMLERVH